MSLRKLITTVAKTVLVTVPVSVAFFDNVGYVAKVEGESMQSCLNPRRPPKLIPPPPRSNGDNNSNERSESFAITGPSQHENDFIWISRWAARNHASVERGDVVAFVSPTRPDRTLIKRVTALEGDAVQTHRRSNTSRYLSIAVGYFWAEGDNWSQSTDSNNFGQVPLGLISGKAVYVVWPPHRWQRISNSTALPEDTQSSKMPATKSAGYSVILSDQKKYYDDDDDDDSDAILANSKISKNSNNSFSTASTDAGLIDWNSSTHQQQRRGAIIPEVEAAVDGII